MTPPTQRQIRAAAKAVRGWFLGLTPMARDALSAHDARALAEQVAWAAVNGTICTTAAPEADRWMVVWHTDTVVRATMPQPRGAAESQYEALKTGWSEVYLVRVECGPREGA